MQAELVTIGYVSVTQENNGIGMLIKDLGTKYTPTQEPFVQPDRELVSTWYGCFIHGVAKIWADACT